MKKKSLIFCAMILFVICASVTSVSAQKLEVREKGKVIATVNVERTEQVRALTISREGQPAHIYRSYPFVSAFSLTIGKDQILTYYSKTRQIELKDTMISRSELNSEAVNYGRGDIKQLFQQVSDDMRILRTVRETMPSVRLFETALVILTGDKSFIMGEPSETLTVSNDVAFVKTSARGQTSGLQNCIARCERTEQRCVQAANGNQASIDRCFDNSFDCQENCERVYGGIQP